MEYNIVLPSKPKVISEEENQGIYEIENLYPGYGHTLGNSLRRIVLSSLPGFAITSLRIEDVPHEFSTISGVKEDVINIILNLKKVRFSTTSEEPQKIKLSAKGEGVVTAKDIDGGSSVTVLTPDQHIATLTDKNAKLDIEINIEKGLGYVAKEAHQEDKMEIGTIAVDAIFTPIRRVNYEVEQMRVGNRTDYNRLRMVIETDGTLSPREALEQSISILLEQLRAIVGFEEPVEEEEEKQEEADADGEEAEKKKEEDAKEDLEVMKTRIESLDLSSRVVNVLLEENVRTVGGLLRKKEEDLLDMSGLGNKGIQEIKRALSNFGLTLKS